MPLIAVFGGTPADTGLGASYLQTVGQRDVLLYPVASSPRTQALFQHEPLPTRTAHIRQLLQAAHRRGAAGAYVYCNSLSGAVDFDALSAELVLPVVTPLHAYTHWAQKYQALGILAANASGLAGIERTLYAASPAIRLSQFACLDVVEAVEQGQNSADIVHDFDLAAVGKLLARLGAEALLLGCTHFSVLREELAPLCSVPLLDPSEAMWELLQSRLAFKR